MFSLFFPPYRPPCSLASPPYRPPGGHPFNPSPTPGPMFSLYRQQLASESTSPIWPDPNDGAQAAAADAIPAEHYLIAPEWLFGTWRNRGRQGQWEERPVCARVPGSLAEAMEVGKPGGKPPLLDKSQPPGNWGTGSRAQGFRVLGHKALGF